MRDQQWDRAVQTSRAAEQEEVCREQWVSAPYSYNIIEAALTLTRLLPTAQFTARVSHTLSKYLRTLRAKAKVLRSQKQQRTTRYTGPPTDRASAARGARASLDCLMHGPRSGRDACVMAEGGAHLRWCYGVYFFRERMAEACSHPQRRRARRAAPRGGRVPFSH